MGQINAQARPVMWPTEMAKEKAAN